MAAGRAFPVASITVTPAARAARSAAALDGSTRLRLSSSVPSMSSATSQMSRRLARDARGPAAASAWRGVIGAAAVASVDAVPARRQ